MVKGILIFFTNSQSKFEGAIWESQAGWLICLKKFMEQTTYTAFERYSLELDAHD